MRLEKLDEILVKRHKRGWKWSKIDESGWKGKEVDQSG